MRKVSAQYVFTSAGKPLRRGVVTVDSDDTVLSVEDTGGNLEEGADIEFYNGIIIPGLVNCHTHLELSHMRGVIPAGRGLTRFIAAIKEGREAGITDIIRAAQLADREMYSEGITACGDINNNALTIRTKSDSRISYVTFIEVFGINPLSARQRMRDAVKVEAAAKAAGLRSYITPHAVYSMSSSLFELIKEKITGTSVTSLHFLESASERKMTGNHIETALELADKTSHLILVHNTVINKEELKALAAADNIWYCLCPSSNMRISGIMPPVNLIRQASDHIVVGTDSLASADHLSILGELRLLHEAVPDLPLDEIIRWGTINGARALRMEDTAGSIEPGKKPGLMLIEKADLSALRLRPDSSVHRLL
jgi:cytosine/adenosine deaminase-related metal-dependent hydrolase